MVWEELTKKKYSISLDWKGQKAEGAGIEQQLDPTNVAPIQIQGMTTQMSCISAEFVISSHPAREGGGGREEIVLNKQLGREELPAR